MGNGVIGGLRFRLHSTTIANTDRERQRKMLPMAPVRTSIATGFENVVNDTVSSCGELLPARF